MYPQTTPRMYPQELSELTSLNMVGSRKPIYHTELADQPTSLPPSLSPRYNRHSDINPNPKAHFDFPPGPSSLPFPPIPRPNSNVTRLTAKYQNIKSGANY